MAHCFSVSISYSGFELRYMVSTSGAPRTTIGLRRQESHSTRPRVVTLSQLRQRGFLGSCTGASAPTQDRNLLDRTNKQGCVLRMRAMNSAIIATMCASRSGDMGEEACSIPSSARVCAGAWVGASEEVCKSYKLVLSIINNYTYTLAPAAVPPVALPMMATLTRPLVMPAVRLKGGNEHLDEA